ncbi:MAG TPA: hypothetical protein VGB30_08185 [bacterium]
MNNDKLINLLPEEYLPEPEFKAFPILAAVLILATVGFVFLTYTSDANRVKKLKNDKASIIAQNEQRYIDAQAFREIQANSRFISSYVAVIPNMVLQSPDYWEIYNEVEEHMPEDTWITQMRFLNVPGRWPDVVLDCISRGYSFNNALDTLDALTGNVEKRTRFKNVVFVNGYQRDAIEGGPVVKFQIRMSVKYPSPETESDS